MHTVQRFRPFGLLAFFVAACLLLAGCGIFDQKPSASSQTVGDNGADLTVAGVHIIVPAGAVPVGTKVEASFEDHSPSGADASLKTLAQAFKIKLGDGLEPSKPLTVTIPVDKSKLINQQGDDTATTVAMMVQSEGASAADLVKGTWDPAASTITAQVPHLSWIWPVQLDLGAVMKNVRDSIMQSLGIEYPKPDCVDRPVTIGDIKYEAVSPAQAWLCVGESGGSLTVTASPNSPIPYLTTTSPAADAANKTEVSLATAFAVAVADNSGFTRKHQAIMMPGAEAEYTLSSPPGGDVTVGFKQYPAMLLLSILAKVFDVALGHFVDSKALEAVEKADCMQNVIGAAQPGKGLSPAVAAGVVKSFFACVGSVVALSPPAQIIMAILGAGPQFLVASALGIINEFTGLDSFQATVHAVRVAPAAPAIPGLPAELSGRWCTRSGPSDCFSAADTKQKYPDAQVIDHSAPRDAPGATDYWICIQLDQGDHCSMAMSMFLRYFPPGVGWNCVQAEVVPGFQSCTPDYTSLRDTSQPRLVRLQNHQQNNWYVDTPPMYHVG